MFQQEKEYLEDAYSHYQKTGERSMQYDFSGTNREKQLTIRCLDALRDDGYILYEYQATVFWFLLLISPLSGYPNHVFLLYAVSFWSDKKYSIGTWKYLAQLLI